MRVPILVEVLRPETHGAPENPRGAPDNPRSEIILLQKRIPKVVRFGIRTHDHSSLANIPFLFLTSFNCTALQIQYRPRARTVQISLTRKISSKATPYTRRDWNLSDGTPALIPRKSSYTAGNVPESEERTPTEEYSSENWLNFPSCKCSRSQTPYYQTRRGLTVLEVVLSRGEGLVVLPTPRAVRTLSYVVRIGKSETSLEFQSRRV